MRKQLMTKAISVLVGMSLGVVMVVGGCSLAKKDATGSATAAATSTSAPQISGARNTPIVQAAAKVGPAVVGITNKAYVRDFFNRVQLTERGTGSGVIYDKSGLIVTNNHVVEGAQEITVSLSNGKTYKGKVLGADAATDLAVVKIDAGELAVAEFGDSSDLQVGETAIAIGNPLGLEFRGSVTVGVISALNRSIEIGERKFKLIQTDAAINPGNSGGALVNVEGKIIGINSAKVAVSGVEGIGFAIPINEVKPIIAELAKKGHIVRPYLGVSLIDQEIANRYGFNLDVRGGVFVMKLAQGGPAWRAGIRPNDIITKFNGKKVSKVAELKELINDSTVGGKVTVTILRGDSEQDVTVTLQEIPQNN